MKVLGVLLFLSSFLMACSGSPQSLASGNSLKGVGSLEEGPGEVLNALRYQGRTQTFPVRDCDLMITVEEHEGHEAFLGQLDTEVHGESARAVEMDFYFLKEGVFFDLNDPAGSGGALVLAGLNADVENPHPNDLSELKTQGLLDEFLLIQFHAGSEAVLFSEALAEAVHLGQIPAEKSEVLNTLANSFFELSHSNHYDNLSCQNFALTGVEEFEFQHGGDHDHEDGDHEDDDHDHDDGHDHDDDHGGDQGEEPDSGN